MEIDLDDYSSFLVTGLYHGSRNRRFKLNYSGNAAGYSTAMNINLWKGSVYGLLKNGKRKLIKRV